MQKHLPKVCFEENDSLLYHHRLDQPQEDWIEHPIFVKLAEELLYLPDKAGCIVKGILIADTSSSVGWFIL